MKKLFNDERWKPILILLSNIVIFDGLIFPGLTAASTFINMLAVLVFIAVFLFDLNYVKEKYFTKSEEEKALEAKWKADLDKKIKQMKKQNKIK